jgi:hypothetical protein
MLASGLSQLRALALAAAFLMAVAHPFSPPVHAATFQTIVNNYNSYDLDADGIDEIEQLKFLWFRTNSLDSPTEEVDMNQKLVLVLVESRLLSELSSSRYSVPDLLSCFVRLRRDLALEGRQAKFLEMKDYDGTRIQEGKTVLAIREFFKNVYTNYPNLDGTLLVGSFPDAGIVRTWVGYPPDTGGNFYTVGVTAGKPRPNDIVLADLDGNWRSMYFESSTSLEGWTITPGTYTTISSNGSNLYLTNAGAVGVGTTRRDFFWLKDARFAVYSLEKGQVWLDLNCASPEATTADRARPNPIARPEISVSRINPRPIAVQPPSSRLLDANGKPQTVTNVPAINLSPPAWPQDASLERTLLVEYLNLNHAYRTGRFASQSFSVSVAWCDITTFAADEGLTGLTPRDTNVHAAFLPDYVQWLKRPSRFRGVAAHSNGSLSAFPLDLPSPDPVDYAALEAACGGHPWSWTESGNRYVSTLQGTHYAELELYRTLWENQVLTNVPPSLMAHVGCTVAGVDFGDLTHNSSGYGTFQNAASLLFYTRQLAILCRITDWNRGPFGFGAAFNASASSVMGDGWKGISTYLSQDTSWYSTQKKQSYIWNLVGDYTLQKSYQVPLANDGWWDARPLTANVSYSMSTTAATSGGDPIPSCVSAPANGVWFTFKPVSNQVMTVNTLESDFDTVLQLLILTNGSLVPVMDGCSDDGDGCGSQSLVAFPATAGTTYYIMAGGYNGLSGNLTITAKEVPLVITRQPTGRTVNAGDTFLVDVLAAGYNVGYRWQRNGVDVSGGTDYLLSLTNVSPSMAGDYRAIVTNASGALTSSVVTLTVQPALATALDNTDLTWTTGGGLGGYGWFRQVDASADGIDSAECGPTDTVSPYSTAWMQTTVTGPATVGFYWWFYKSLTSRSLDYLGVFLDGVYQAGASSPFGTFAHQNVYVGSGSHTIKWQYVRAGLFHGGGPGYVDQVNVTPGGTPAFIVTQPAAQAILAGSNATFTVTLSGTPPFSYQWLFNDVSIANQTNSTLLLSNVQPVQAGNYSVLVANGYGTPWVSSNAALGVSTVPLPVAADYAGPPWSTSGQSSWFGQVGVTSDSVDAAQSGWLTNSQQSALTLQLAGPGTLAFWWKVSSETNYDFLRFSTNGVVKTNISGEVGWRGETFSLLPGKQVVSWTYAKDSSLSRGQDAGWIDQITYDGAPCLSWVTPTPEQILLQWPCSVAGYTLQISTNLQSPLSWQPVTNPVGVLDDNWRVTNSTLAPQQFYRLKK